MTGLKTLLQGLFAVLLIAASGTVRADTAGHVQFVSGEVQLTSPEGTSHRIRKGDAVNEGDTLNSAKNASAQIKMQDGGLIALRPDTRLTFDSFKYSGKQDGTEKSVISLVKGGFRAITGAVGQVNKSSYRITTPTSTIGIRGTDHESIVVVPGSALAALAAVGTYNKVNVGETFIATEKGSIAVLPNQMGYAGASDQMPTLQPLNTGLFTVAASPAPQRGDGEEEPVRENAAVDNEAQQDGPAAQSGAAGSPVTTNVAQTPVTTTGGTTLNGGGGSTLPAVGTGGITYFLNSTGCTGGCLTAGPAMRLFGDKAKYATDALGLSAFQMLTVGDGGKRGTATVLDGGNVTLAGGVETMGWGRWSGAGATLTQASGAVVPLDILHYVGGSPAATMPITGIANYIAAGGTRPTDALGNLGQFTGATIQADFAAARLSVGINVAFNGVAYAATGSGNFAADGVIQATRMANLTCNPVCMTSPTPPAADFAGAFNGTNASGLGLVYNISDPGRNVALVGAQAFIKQ